VSAFFAFLLQEVIVHYQQSESSHSTGYFIGHIGGNRGTEAKGGDLILYHLINKEAYLKEGGGA
jgi:hypothetical protein